VARFDVYPNPGGGGKLLDVQADLLDGLNTRVVVPLMNKKSAPTPASHLNPVLQIDDQPMVMVTQFLAAVPARMLVRAETNLMEQRDEIVAALDFLFQGF
jgi:toxin CcdB